MKQNMIQRFATQFCCFYKNDKVLYQLWLPGKFNDMFWADIVFKLFLLNT